MCKIAINISSQDGYSEVDVSGTAADFVNLASHLTKISTDMFTLKHRPNTYFPATMSHISLELVDQSNGLITAQVNDSEFKLLGDLQAYRKLADFMESLSGLRLGEHFHLDWFSNEDLLAPVTSTMSFIFSMEV